jgi:hypothetical protein
MVGTDSANLENTVETALESYAQKGVFRGFGRVPDQRGKPSFKMLWHHGKTFVLLFDPKTLTLRFPVLLPEVPANSAMHKSFKAYLKSRQHESLPDHRRVDIDRVTLRTLNRNGSISLSMKSNDGDLEYATRKLIQLVHEIFLDFLSDGLYYDYLVDVFDLDVDAV